MESPFSVITTDNFYKDFKYCHWIIIMDLANEKLTTKSVKHRYSTEWKDMHIQYSITVHRCMHPMISFFQWTVCQKVHVSWCNTSDSQTYPAITIIITYFVFRIWKCSKWQQLLNTVETSIFRCCIMKWGFSFLENKIVYEFNYSKDFSYFRHK